MTPLLSRASKLVVLALTLSASAAHAGGPRYVAGTAYFDPAALGKPIVWADGQLRYYTDLGDLSASVPQTEANSMIAAAAAVWNAVPTAAVNIASAGSLAENVSAANVSSTGNTVNLPADIQSGDTAKSIAIVYDEDGSVINALFGAGASTPTMCQQNGVFTFVDNLAPSGNIVHALMILNGLCAARSANLTVLSYQLVRAFGQVLGLDWSQANEEMFGSQLTAANTLSVTGTITFRNGQGMQGVNVVLRPMIPGTTLPDVRYTATAVSGAYFRGNAGNPVTGSTDAYGNPLARFGDSDLAKEGYFDLSGVPIPPGDANDTWQLSLEPINPLYTGSESVGPYTTGQVAPSGTLPTIAIPGLAAGASVIQNITIGNSAGDSLSGNDGVISTPVTVPPSGEWTARLAGYGHTSWLEWWAKANREFTVEAYALDDKGEPTLNKSQIVLGMWNGTDSISAAPVTFTLQPFNGAVAGLTTLPVRTLADSEVRLGISDLRGDGRPDYLYRGRVLYADTVRPAILPSAGGPMAITGMGFRPDSVVFVNGVAAAVTSVSPTEITAIAPASGGATGNVSVEVKNPKSLASPSSPTA